MNFTIPFGFTLSNYWKLETIHNQNGSIINNTDINSNPTVNTSKLTLLSNFLEYGAYKLTYVANITTVYNDVLVKETSTFFSIMPTGINVFVFENSQTNVTIGQVQPLVLDPVTFSYDLDSLADVGSLEFKFYCMVVNSTLVNINFLTNGSYRNLTDLKTAKVNNMLTNQSCFNSTGIDLLVEI